MGLDDLESEALKLNATERALLAERLFLSLDAPSEEENLRLWVTEAERRLGELRAGDTVEVSSQDVLRRARAAIA